MDSVWSRPADTLFVLYRQCGSTFIRDVLVTRHLPYLEALASRYCRRCHGLVTRDELVSAAAPALVRTIERFNPGAGVRFLTFATPRLWGQLIRASQQHYAARYPTSGLMLNSTVDADGEVIREPLPQHTEPDPSERMVRAEFWASMTHGCTPRERAVVRRMFLAGETQCEAARALGIDQSTVSDTRARVLARLRARGRDWVLARMAG